MPVEHRLQPSFNNGEVSPLLYDRVDFQKFVSSVKSGKNMFVHAQGGMSNRAGTVMLAQAKDEKVLLVPFEFSSTETYVIEFGNGYCRFFTANGQVINEYNDPYEIQSPFVTADLDKIRFCQSGDVMYIAWGGKPKCLIREGHTNWHFEDYDFKNGPISMQNEYKGFFTALSGSKSFNWLAVAGGASNPVSLCSDDFSSWEVFGDIDFFKNSVVCNDILFTSNGGTIYYSTDGLNWIRLSQNIECSNFSIKYNGSYFLLLVNISASVSKLFRFSSVSSPIIEITNLPFFGAWPFLMYQNNLFFVLASSFAYGTSFSFYYSSDGSNWINSYISANSTDYYRYTPKDYIIFYDNNYYVFLNGFDRIKKYNTSFELIDDDIRLPNGVYLTPREPSVAFSSLYFIANVSASPLDFSALYVFNGSVFQDISDGKSIDFIALYFYDNKKFVLALNDSFELDSSNNLTSINVPEGYAYFSKILSFSFIAPEADALFTSSEYTFTSKDLNRKFAVEIQTESFSESSINSGTSNVHIGTGPWSLNTTGTWQGTISIEYSLDNDTWNEYRTYSSPSTSNPQNIAASGSFDSIYFLRIKRENIVGTFSFTFNCAGADLYIFFSAREIVSDSSIAITAESDSKPFVSFVTDKTGKMYLSLWSPYVAYPQDVDLYQDRITWATNNQLDATKISDYTNFGVSTDVTEDDAISVIVKDKKVDKINSIVAGQKLAVFSDDGNFIHNNDTFTPQAATFLKQGATGGSDVKPVVVRDHIIYAHPMKQAVSDYAYNFETDGYAGQDITLLANHLFDGKVIKTLAYQQEPYSIIWVLLEDGTVLSCTYLRQQQVIAWTPMDFGGQVKSIAVCSTGTEEHLYLAVKRKNGTFVEKMPTRLLTSDPKECFFVDCGRTYRGEPATVISGLDYLEGEQVSVLADGNVVNGLTVEDGAITIPVAASIVTVGLPYESVLETLTFDANMGDGTTLNRKKRVVALSVRYNQSRGSKVSVNGHREIDMLKREQEAYNAPISLKSGVYREILPSTHNASTNVKIRQIDPLPITIVSVIPEIEYER